MMLPDFQICVSAPLSSDRFHHILKTVPTFDYAEAATVGVL